MILIREVFQLKFGKAKEAKALAKEGAELEKKYGYTPSRNLTDLTGQYYTLVSERTYKSLGDFEQELQKVFANKDFSAWYQKMVPLVESGRREIFTIVE
jgi:hypothetical protein